MPFSNKIAYNPPTVHYRDVMASDGGVCDWTKKIVHSRCSYQHLELTNSNKKARYGFCYVEGCPITPQATQKLLERIAFIRHTHYGGFWDFTSDLSSKDTAYTSLALNAHTDTTYFSEPAGLQMFHLLSHEEGVGGASLLIDGFRAASILSVEDPHAYRTLMDVKVPTHASGNEGISIQPYAPFPVLNHHPVTGLLTQVRWNNDDRATMDQWRYFEESEDWYEAARKWTDVLQRETSQYWEQLRPGKPLIFDNWRVLHGRSAFTGKRRLCGGYISRDDFVSRYRMTNSTREEVLREL
ncbi:MAG: hypothetical protein M1836_003527 [Candelina mexicana]|nr:MAG: hypothetical protein M1836_003527 [Candelina mexicana]